MDGSFFYQRIHLRTATFASLYRLLLFHSSFVYWKLNHKWASIQDAFFSFSVDDNMDGGIYTIRQPVSDVRYRVLGIGRATEFFTVDATTGIVRIQKPLNEDSTGIYYLKVSEPTHHFTRILHSFLGTAV